MTDIMTLLRSIKQIIIDATWAQLFSNRAIDIDAGRSDDNDAHTSLK